MKWVAFLSLYLITAVMNQPSKTDEVLLNREFNLRIAHKATIKSERLSVTFKSVIEDSRCPRGVDCIWAGNAKLEFEITGPTNGPIHIELNTNGEPSHAHFLKYDVKLIDLSPYPEANSGIDKKRYTARIVITSKART